MNPFLINGHKFHLRAYEGRELKAGSLPLSGKRKNELAHKGKGRLMLPGLGHPAGMGEAIPRASGASYSPGVAKRPRFPAPQPRA